MSDKREALTLTERLITELVARLDETTFVLLDRDYATSQTCEALARCNREALSTARAWLADAKTAKEERA